MLCAIVSENQKNIAILTGQAEAAGLRCIVFYNSIVALSHLALFRPDYLVIDSTAFSFISYPSFVTRFQLYDQTLSHLIVISDRLGTDPVPMQKANLLSAPGELSAALQQLLSRHACTPVPAASNDCEPPAFFFSSPADACAAPDPGAYLFRIHVCLLGGRCSEMLDLLDRLFFALNAEADYARYHRACEALNALYAQAQTALLAQPPAEYLEGHRFQDIFQALTHYKKRFYTLCDLVASRLSAACPNVGQLIRYILENDGAPLTLQDLSRRFHFNPSYLSHLFKETTGIGLSAFINQVRIHHACSLLEESNRSVAMVAAYTGYADSKYFARIFKSITGLSPSAYRQAFPLAGARQGR